MKVMVSLARFLVVLAVLITFIIFPAGTSFAQEIEKEVNLLEKKKNKSGMADNKEQVADCPCIIPAVTALKETYKSLEEDTWTVAITECKKSLESINTLAKTCKCSEIDLYKKAAEAFLHYAEGGDHLDSRDTPNCAYVVKLYDNVIATLNDLKDKLKNKETKTAVQNILDYSKEEREFIKDECQDQKKQ